MKKRVFLLGALFQTVLYSCSTSKPAIDNSIILKDHQAPYRIFGVGYWNPDYSILTLTDATNHYFVIKTPKTDSAKIGSNYQP